MSASNCFRHKRPKDLFGSSSTFSSCRFSRCSSRCSSPCCSVNWYAAKCNSITQLCLFFFRRPTVPYASSCVKAHAMQWQLHAKLSDPLVMWCRIQLVINIATSAVFWSVLPQVVCAQSASAIMLQIREKNLQPEHAAQLAQHITSGRIRVSELGSLASVANQEQLVHLLP